MKEPSLTLGIEEEYQIVDPETRELKSYITEILESDHIVLRELKPELHQSVVEVGSTVCETPAEAWHGEPGHRFSVVVLVAFTQEVAAAEPGGPWIRSTQQVRADLRAREIAIITAGYIRHLGYEAVAHTATAADLENRSVMRKKGPQKAFKCETPFRTKDPDVRPGFQILL